jgi:hypothetical protein
MNIYNKLRADLQLREAIRKADEAHQANGWRYFVVPSAVEDGVLLVMDRATFRDFKRKHYISTQATIGSLLTTSFYHTPTRGGLGAIEATELATKRRAYYEWWQLVYYNRRDKLRGLKRLLAPLFTHQ